MTWTPAEQQELRDLLKSQAKADAALKRWTLLDGYRDEGKLIVKTTVTPKAPRPPRQSYTGTVDPLVAALGKTRESSKMFSTLTTGRDDERFN